MKTLFWQLWKEIQRKQNDKWAQQRAQQQQYERFTMKSAGLKMCMEYGRLRFLSLMQPKLWPKHRLSLGICECMGR